MSRRINHDDFFNFYSQDEVKIFKTSLGRVLEIGTVSVWRLNYSLSVGSAQPIVKPLLNALTNAKFVELKRRVQQIVIL